MKKNIIIIGVTSLFFISGCSINGKEQANKQDTITPVKVHSPANFNNKNDDKNQSDDFGFSRVNKTIINGKNIENQITSVDREQLAKIISNLSIQLPDIHDVSVLVTDKEVLVVYKTNSNNRKKTAEQVKRTAMSTVPRYYHVYVSDNIALAQNIKNYAPLESGSQGIDYSIRKTIKEMLKSPQGSKNK